MNLAYKLAGLLAGKCPPPRNMHTIGPECFGANWPDDFPEVHGYPEIICYRGQNYVPQKPGLRVRLHNWLVRVGERRHNSEQWFLDSEQLDQVRTDIKAAIKADLDALREQGKL